MEKHQFKFPHSPLKIFSFLLVSALFAGVATLLIASAKGYKLEQKGFNFTFKKTGTLIITSQPSGAKIYINGKLYKKNSGSNLFATKINSLFSGKYNLRIEKEGYIPWAKDVEIKEEAVTWANYVKLFPTEMKEEEVLPQPIVFAKQSNDTRRLVLGITNQQNELEIHALDTFSLNKTKIYPSEKNKPFALSPTSIDWSYDNSKLLIQADLSGKKNYLLFNAREEADIVNITDLFKFDFEKLVFNPLESRELFGLKDGNIYKLNIQDKTMSVALMDKVISFELGPDRAIYGVRNESEEIALYKSDFSGNNVKKIIKSLPKSGNYKIQYSGSANKILLIVNGDIKTAYLADKLENVIELTQLEQEVTGALWSPNGKRIMLRNDRNIWVYDLEKKKSYETLKDKGIRYASWDEGNDHLALNIDGEYKILEYDGTNGVKIGDSSANEVFFSTENKNYLCIEKDKNGINKLINYKR